MNQPRILVVDDDPDLLHLIGVRLSVAGYEVISAASGEEALQRFHADHPQAVITDLRMEGMDGHALFARLHAEAPSLPVIILTAHGTIPDAVAATQRGAFGFLTKPFEGKELLERVAAAVALSPPVAPEDANSRWREGIVSCSPLMDELLRQARRAADDATPLLVCGPAGAGKAQLARAIHAAGPRAKKRFVVLSPSGLTEPELEKELAGGEALRSAQGGTLYIDEAGLLTAVAQARLLGMVRASTELFSRPRAGQPDVRVIAGTAMPLERAIREGSFRADLYYALAAATLRVPSLAERLEDIPRLVAHFVERQGSGHNVSPEALALIQEASWPGNVRQLEHVLEQALRLAVTPLVPASLVQRLLQESSALELAGFDEARRAFERDYLERLLQATGGNVARAARIAQRNRTEFYKLLARHGLEPGAFK
jgi:two-component system response regulator GlrR